MKPINVIKSLGLAALAWTTLSFTACSESKTEEFVDLRYDVEDLYERPHTDPEVITLRVRSLHTPWEIVGDDASADWYTITPSHGEAGETVTVTITMKNNPDLDDREDLLSIKSDYWTGKQFRIFQKGTAFIEAEGFMFDKDGEDNELTILSNQKWSAAVTSGEEWLSITSTANGELDGKISLHAVPNKSERRPGVVTLYDRYDRPTVDVKFTQDGVVLDWYKPYDEDPEPDEDPVDWVRCYYDNESLEFPVEFNASWNVEKKDPSTEDWYTVEQVSYKGSDDGKTVIEGQKLKINLTPNTTQSLRTGTLVLTTVPESADVEPVVREIVFKQAYSPAPIELATNVSVVVGGSRIKTGIDAGRYDFKVQGANGKRMEIIFFYPDKPSGDSPRELRYWTNRVNGTDDGYLMMSTLPWCDNPFNIDACIKIADENAANPGTYAKIDKDLEHTLSLEIQKAKVLIEGKDGAEDTYEMWARIIWYIDGKLIQLPNGNNQSIMLSNNQWNMTFDEMLSETGYIVARGDYKLIECTLTPPINWGN